MGIIRRILVASVEAKLSRDLTTLLREFGYEVTTTDSGQTVLREAAEGAIDLVVLDSWLADIDSHQALSQLRHQGAKVRVFELSSLRAQGAPEVPGPRLNSSPSRTLDERLAVLKALLNYLDPERGPGSRMRAPAPGPGANSFEIPSFGDSLSSEDLLRLVQHYLERHRFTSSSPPARISDEAFKRLMQHNWQGNVRDLEITIQRAVVLARGGTIKSEHLTLDST